jgi:hypothetical protein
MILDSSYLATEEAFGIFYFTYALGRDRQDFDIGESKSFFELFSPKSCSVFKIQSANDFPSYFSVFFVILVRVSIVLQI